MASHSSSSWPTTLATQRVAPRGQGNCSDFIGGSCSSSAVPCALCTPGTSADSSTQRCSSADPCRCATTPEIGCVPESQSTLFTNTDVVYTGDALLVNATAVLAVMATSPPAALPWVPAMTQALRVWATMPQQPHTPLVLALVHAAIHTSTSAGPQPITQPLGSTGTDTECAVDALLLRSRLLLEVAAPHVPAEALQLRQHHTALQHHALQKTLADRPATSHSGHHGATACIFDQTVLCECIQGCTDGRPGGRHIASCCMSAAAYELLQAALRVSSCAWVSVQLMERVVACTAEVGGTQQPLETARCCALVSAWFDMHAQLPSGTPQQDAVGSRAATNAPVWQRPEASVEPDMVRFTQVRLLYRVVFHTFPGAHMCLHALRRCMRGCCHCLHGERGTLQLPCERLHSTHCSKHAGVMGQVPPTGWPP